MNISSNLRWTMGAAFLCALAGCQKPAPSAGESSNTATATPVPAPARLVSAEPNSFEIVTRHLDSGGGMFVYLSTENFLKTVSTKLDQVAPLVLSAAKMGPVEKAQAEAAWNLIGRLTAKSGLSEISGFGASCIAVEPGYYQTKWMLHHYEGKETGCLWQLCPSAPNALDLVSYLPENTALAAGGNLTLTPAWNAICAESGSNAQLAAGLQAATEALEKSTGLKLSKIIAGIGPAYGLVLTLDENRKTTLPGGPGGKTITIPEPGLALLIQVKDVALADWVDRKLVEVPGVVSVNEADLKLRMIPVPAPLPFLRPVVAWKKDLLMIASSDLLVREMTAVKAGKKTGIAANSGFKKLMAGLPASGCQFSFTAPVFQNTIKELQALAVEQSPAGTDPAVKRLLQSLGAAAHDSWTGGVVENTPEGFLGTFRGNVEGSQVLVAAGGVAPAAMVSAIAVPNFLRARKRSQAVRVLEDLRMLDAAIDQYAIEHNKGSGTPVPFSDLQAFLKQGSVLYKSDNKDLLGNSYNGGEPYKVDSVPKVNPATFNALSDVAPPAFWSPFR